MTARAYIAKNVRLTTDHARDLASLLERARNGLAPQLEPHATPDRETSEAEIIGRAISYALDHCEGSKP